MGHGVNTCSIERLTSDAKEILREMREERYLEQQRKALAELLEAAAKDPIAPYRELEWRPRYVVWELTLACNMRCTHCGSAAGKARPDELSLDEMLQVCDDLGQLGCERITLLGGEPLIHPHWEVVARRIRDNGYRANVITNGWTLDDERTADAIKDVGLTIVGISVDGYGKSHDDLRRRQGSFQKILHGIDLLRERDVPVALSTVITKDSLGELPQLRDLALSKGIKVWQLQVACPLGRMTREDPLLIRPEQLSEVFAFAVETNSRGGDLTIDLADNVGYYGSYMERDLGRNHRGKYAVWRGCYAGITAMGLDSNGDVKGCQSHPSLPEFIAGNIRQRSLLDIWNDPSSFPHTRGFTPSMLSGACAQCQYGSLCKAGCTSQAHAWTGNAGDNPMCLHRVEQLSNRSPEK
jgi:radical SAM protein with 4Fe4S-binding SPASM domain